MKFTEDVAKVVYKLLVEEFGKDFLEGDDKKVINNWRDIKTFEDACLVTGDNPLNKKFTDDEKDVIAYRKLKVIYKAINQGWLPNWSDSNQCKFYPWYTAASGGVGFSSTTYGYTTTSTRVGFFLCTSDNEKCLYIASQFESLYKEYILNV